MSGGGPSGPRELEAGEVAEIFARLAARRPRVQCLTNTVAQAITANLLLAAGADVSMAVHPEEIVPMSAGADALLINLGTLDPLREESIGRLMAARDQLAMPIVLDPVFVDLSPRRLALARSLTGLPRLILRGNAREMAAMGEGALLRVTTGETDVIAGPTGEYRIQRGHPLMAKVTGLGCAASALIAAFAAVEEDAALAAAAALTCLGMAGERAALRAKGPGSFAVALIDSLSELHESNPAQSPGTA